nr:ATP-binding cassette domain-containing protein [Granulicatella sp. 19428wC4_WM01]
MTDINLIIKKGDYVSLVGLNDVGKSELIKMMISLLKETQ